VEALKFNNKLQYEDRIMSIVELKTPSKLEKSIQSNQNIVYVDNLPDKPKKKDIIDCMNYTGIPVKKVIRLIKIRNHHFLGQDQQNEMTYRCILQLEDSFLVDIEALNRASIFFFGKILKFSRF